MPHLVGARRWSPLLAFAVAVALAVGPAPSSASAQIPTEPLGHHPCIKGKAGPFRCHQIDLMSFLPSSAIGDGPGSQYGGSGNDVWGWTDPVTHREWVVMGRSNGTAFVDITDPKRPVFVANLPLHGVVELHSDIKMYENHAFIVKDGPANGVQVFDLTRLRGIDNDDAPATVDADAVYEGISNAHNLHINEDTGFAYVVGATGGAIGELANRVTIDAPSSAAGAYQATGANFGPAPDDAGVSGDVVSVNDGVGTTTDGCQPLVGFPAGSVALVDRGGCTFTVKANNAQDAGAAAMIVANNADGAPFTMRGSDPGIVIASVMVSRADGNTMKAGLPASGAVSRNPQANPCDRGGLHVVDIREPKNPTYAGCFDDDGYTHDVQCVTYHGPDVSYEGREICFASNPDPQTQGRLTVVDVTDKSNPAMLSRALQGEPYSYSHQGWMTEDQRYFLHDDESDEIRFPGRTRTRIFDVTDLDNVFVQSVYHGETRAADHNLYVKGRYAYLTNYFDGLRVVNLTKIDFPGNVFAPDTPTLVDHQGLWEAACFDTDPVRNNIAGFGGVWSNYPWFKNHVVAVSGFEGLWILRTRLGSDAASPPAPPNGGRGGGRTDGCREVAPAAEPWPHGAADPRSRCPVAAQPWPRRPLGPSRISRGSCS